MLHIIGMILKIIGIILAVILGILVLLICIVLFVPLKYEIKAKFEGTLDSVNVKFRCSWLLHLLAASFSFEDREFTWKARVVHKVFGSEETVSKAEETLKTDVEEVYKKEPEVKKAKLPKETRIDESAVTIQERRIEAAEDESEEKAGEKTEEKTEKEGFWVRIEGKCKALWNKIKTFFENIKYTFGKICDKIKLLLEKKEIIAAFVEDEVHRLAFARLKKEAFRLLKFLRPKKFMLRTRFGFEDPYHTGQALAVLSVIYPFWGGQLSVEPDVEKRILEGELLLNGKIRTVYALIAAWNLFWDKNVRKLYTDVKSMGNKV